MRISIPDAKAKNWTKLLAMGAIVTSAIVVSPVIIR